MAGYIAATIPARTVHISNTTLFNVAQQEMGDALYWVQIAQLNGITDPWVTELTAVKIPPVPSSAPLTGILGL